MLTRVILFAAALVLISAGLSRDASGAEIWNDRPLRIVQTAPASFPPSLAAEGVTEGEVWAVLHVDAAGRLVDYLVTAHTRPEFAHALEAVVRDWDFEPARQRGEPVGSRIEAVFAFQARGMVVSLTPIDTATVATNRLVRREATTLLCPPGELDEPVRAVHVVQPSLPRDAVPLRSGRPTAAVDFYIDREGRVRMPVAVRATHELYAMAAVEALLQWRFLPPLRRGQPVMVRATQVFSFPERTR